MIKTLKFKFLKLSVFALIIIFSSSPVILAQSKPDKIDKLLNQFTEYGQFNGSVLVAEKGKVIFKKGFGLANMEWDIPNASDTKHRLGSITKQFTAVLILQLVEQGKLKLEGKVTDYLPDYPKANGDKITIHHLLTHTAGIPNYTSFPDFFKDYSRDPYAPEEFVTFWADSLLEFEPGEKFAYSNSGYFLLGAIIEKVSGKSYEQMLQENIFTPLKMVNSGFDHHRTILKNRATGYEKNGNEYRNSDYLDMSIPYSAGSLYSTVEDLYLWDQALYSDQILSTEMTELMFKDHIPAMGGHYGYGWITNKMPIGLSSDSVNIIAHGGGINGFNTLILRIPSKKHLVVLLNNTGGTSLNSMATGITAILYKKEYASPKKSIALTLAETIEHNGIAAGLEEYKKIKDSDDFRLSEGEMNALGYQLLQNDKVDDAIAIFKLNVEAFPESANVYDSYGEALLERGDKEEAITNYKKSIELNPGNQNGIDVLKRLGVISDNKDIVVDAEILETYVGKYELAPGFILTVTKEGNQMKTQATGQSQVDIFPSSENTFYLKVVNAQLTFNKGDQGDITSVTLHQGGRDIVGEKMLD